MAMRERLDFKTVTTESPVAPDVLGTELVPNIRQDRLTIPGFEVISEADGSKIIAIDGPEVFAQRVSDIIAGGKRDVESVLLELSKTGKAIRGTGFTMSANYAAFLKEFSTATNVKIVHVEGFSTDDRKEFDGRKQTTFGLTYEAIDPITDEAYSAFSSFTFTSPILETRRTTIDGEMDDQSANFSSNMDLSGLGNQDKQDYFKKHYGAKAGVSPKVKYYENAEGNEVLDMIVGADAVEYFGLTVTPLEAGKTEELVITSFKKLINAAADTTRRGETLFDEDGKFVVRAWNESRETVEEGLSLEDVKNMVAEGCRIVVR